MATRPPKTNSAAGTTFGLAAGAPATFNSAGFLAQTFKNIGKIKNGGEFGKQFEIIKNNYLSQRGTEKSKGTFDAGSINLEVDLNGDEGQLLCETAVDSDADYSFSINFKNGDIYYLRGLLTSFRIKVGGPNDMISVTITLELNPIFAEGGTEVAAIKVTAP